MKDGIRSDFLEGEETEPSTSNRSLPAAAQQAQAGTAWQEHSNLLAEPWAPYCKQYLEQEDKHQISFSVMLFTACIAAASGVQVWNRGWWDESI